TQPQGLDGIEVVGDSYEACKDADLLLILTDWPEFADADLDKVAELPGERRVVDTPRNLLDPGDMAGRGFLYDSIGRPAPCSSRPAAHSTPERVSTAVITGSAGLIGSEAALHFGRSAWTSSASTTTCAGSSSARTDVRANSGQTNVDKRPQRGPTATIPPSTKALVGQF
ncbi:MAG: UDP binding domain-containing protein, partial [Nocardioides sp.]